MNRIDATITNLEGLVEKYASGGVDSDTRHRRDSGHKCAGDAPAYPPPRWTPSELSRCDSDPLANQLICDLTYISYATQRELAPEVSPESWAKLLGFTPEGAAAMEKRYQQEQECVVPPIRVNGGDLR